MSCPHRCPSYGALTCASTLILQTLNLDLSKESVDAILLACLGGVPCQEMPSYAFMEGSFFNISCKMRGSKLLSKVSCRLAARRVGHKGHDMSFGACGVS